MTREELDFIGSMNMCDEISNEAYKKIVCHCEEQEPCEDAMNRILKRMWNCRGKHTTSIDKVKMEQILRDELPLVNPQTKTGHWDSRTCKCSECSYQITFSEYTEHKYKYCPNCGAKMIDPQESEEVSERNMKMWEELFKAERSEE